MSSILEKLKDLVSAMEGQAEAEPEAPNEPVEEQDEPQLPEDVTMSEIPMTVECSPEESLEVYKAVSKILSEKEALANLVLSFEKKKAALLNSVISDTDSLYQRLNSLRLEYGVPQEGYAVQLPSSPSDPVVFEKE